MRTASRLNPQLVYRCHIRRTHGPTLDGQYCSQKTGTKPRQVHYGSDAELAAAIFDLEGRIAAADPTVTRSRVSRPFASMDL